MTALTLGAAACSSDSDTPEDDPVEVPSDDPAGDTLPADPTLDE